MMSKKVAYLITVCLLMPALVAASNPLIIIPTELLVPTATSLNVELVGSWPVANVVDLFISGNQAYVAHHLDLSGTETDAILSILDISDPAQPIEINRIEGPYAQSYQVVYADSSYIYTAEDYPHAAGPQIRAYLHADQENYVCWNKFDYYSEVVEMWSQSGYWMIVDANFNDDTGNGLQVYKPVPTEPYDNCEPVTSYEVTGDVTAATYDDQYAYIGTADGSLWILDVSDPNLPSKVSNTPYGSSSIDAIATAPGYVYMAHGTEVKIIDITNPASPGAAQSFTSPVEVAQLGADSGYLYITFENGMYVYDVRDSSAPVQAGTYLDYDDEGFGSALYLENDLIFTGGLDYMYILRFTQAAQPALILETLGPGVVVDGLPISSECDLPSLPPGSQLLSISEDCPEVKSGTEIRFKFPETKFGMYLQCFISTTHTLSQLGLMANKGKYEDALIIFASIDAHELCKNNLPTSTLGKTSQNLLIDHVSGELQYSVLLEELPIEIETSATVLQSDGANDFSIRHDQASNQTTVRCYNGSVILIPKNPTLPPIPLSTGQQVEITSEAVGPITEITYQAFMPLLVK